MVGVCVWEGVCGCKLLTLQICSNPAVMLASGPTCEEWREEEGEGGRAAGVVPANTNYQ